MLIDEHDPNILPFVREGLESTLDGRVVGLGVDNQEVLLGLWGRRDMLIIFLQSSEIDAGLPVGFPR